MGEDTTAAILLGVLGLFGVISLLAYLASRPPPVAPPPPEPPSEVVVEETEEGWVIKERILKPAGKGHWKLVKLGPAGVQSVQQA